MTDVAVYPACLRDVFEAIATESLQCGMGEPFHSQILADNRTLLKMIDAPAPNNQMPLGPLSLQYPNTTFHTMFTSKAHVPPAGAPYDVVFTISRFADFMAPARLADETGNDVSNRVAKIGFSTTSDHDPLITFDTLEEARRFVIPVLALGGCRTLRMEVVLSDKTAQASQWVLEMDAYFVTAGIRSRVIRDGLDGIVRVWPTGDGRTLVTLANKWIVTKPWCAHQ